MSDPRPPAVPDRAPLDLQEFIACRQSSVTIRGGPLDWLPMGDALGGLVPVLGLEPGASPGTGTITVDLGLATLCLPVSIVGGELRVDSSGLPAILGGAGDALQAWLRDLNAWLRANRRRLRPAEIRDNAVTLEKEPIPAADGDAAGGGAGTDAAGGGGAPGTRPPVAPPAAPPASARGCLDRLGLGILVLGLIAVVGVGGVVSGLIPLGDTPSGSQAPSATADATGGTGPGPGRTASPPASVEPDGVRLARQLLAEVGVADPEEIERLPWTTDGTRDWFLPVPGTAPARMPAEIDHRFATAFGVLDLDTAALEAFAPCGEGEQRSFADTTYRVACNQRTALPTGSYTIVVTVFDGGYPGDVPDLGLHSWSVFADTDRDPATGFRSSAPDNFLIGADIYYEMLAFPGQAGFRNYILATRPADPPRADTGQTQGNLRTDARAIWFAEAGIIVWVLPADQLDGCWNAGAFSTTDRSANSPATLAVDALGSPSDEDYRWCLQLAGYY